MTGVWVSREKVQKNWHASVWAGGGETNHALLLWCAWHNWRMPVHLFGESPGMSVAAIHVESDLGVVTLTMAVPVEIDGTRTVTVGSLAAAVAASAHAPKRWDGGGLLVDGIAKTWQQPLWIEMNDWVDGSWGARGCGVELSAALRWVWKRARPFAEGERVELGVDEWGRKIAAGSHIVLVEEREFP